MVTADAEAHNETVHCVPIDVRVPAKPPGSRVESLLATKNLGATGFFSTSRYASFASSADGQKKEGLARDEAELLDNGDVMSGSPPWSPC